MSQKRRIITVVSLVALIAIGYFTYEYVMYVSTDNAQIDAHSVLLAPKVSGFISKVNVVEGQAVKSGDILVEIDERDYANAVKQTTAEKSSLEARFKDAERNYNRIKELFNKEAVSHQQYDQAAALASELRAKYESVSAQVAQAELNFENTKIKAPSDGFIAKKSAELGQLAAPGVPLIGFVDGGNRWVTANFKETEIEAIKVGAHADVDVDAISAKKFGGVVESISSATGATFTLLPPDNATGNFTKVVQRVPVKIRLENLNADDVRNLRAGLSALVKVHKH